MFSRASDEWSTPQDFFEALDLEFRFSVDAAATAATTKCGLDYFGPDAPAMAYRDEVAALPLFRDLAPHELDLLLTRLTPVSAAPGQEVIRQGEPGDRFYVLLSGAVEVERDGRVIDRMGPGAAFGEIALLLDVPRTATVRATSPCALLALAAADFGDLLTGYLGRAEELERLSSLRLDHHKRLDQLVAP